MIISECSFFFTKGDASGVFHDESLSNSKLFGIIRYNTVGVYITKVNAKSIGTLCNLLQ